jgi:hypothetical protein
MFTVSLPFAVLHFAGASKALRRISMRTRFQQILSLLLLMSLMASSPLLAQKEDSPLSVPRTLEQAEAQLQKADTLRMEAKKHHTEEEAACYQKILVSACLDEAKERYLNTLIEARKLEAHAREFQRASRRSEVTAEKDQRAAEQSARKAGQQKRTERYRTDESAKTVEREQKQLDKERKAEENKKKLDEKQAKRQLKEKKRLKKQAERIEKTGRERARAEEKAADRAARENKK